jgi:hypothetical protein
MKVLLFTTPFVVAFLLARFVEMWRGMIVSLATLIAIFALLFLFKPTNDVAMIAGATLMVSTILGPIYIVGLVTGNFFRKPSASKETKPDQSM